jgi:hypothetical protein
MTTKYKKPINRIKSNPKYNNDKNLTFLFGEDEKNLVKK